MSKSSIQRLIDIIYQSLTRLDVHIALPDLENMAVMVHKAMMMQTRHFHNLEHVFAQARSADPIQSLAAIFHDIVYYQVDQGFLPEIEAIISPYIQVVGNDIFLIRKINPQDQLFILVLEAFNFSPGQKLSPDRGLNEFLSALVMVKALQGIVPEKDLLEMTVCVEATIPFQGINAAGENHFDVLEKRLATINEKYHFDLSQKDIQDAVRLAVTFSNKDVENFAERNPSRFLDNTWKLLPETNIALRSRHIYSIHDYRQALERMESFFADLDPYNVFNQYKGFPSEKKYQQLVERARKNILTSREYLRIKLLPVAVLEALAEATGGDAPLSLFTGEVVQSRSRTTRVEDFLPEPETDHTEPDSVIVKLLDTGRASQINFDLRNSPLSLFIYRSLEADKIDAMFLQAKRMFAGELSAQEFLKTIDPRIFYAVTQACAMMVFTRQEKILQLIANYPQDMI